MELDITTYVEQAGLAINLFAVLVVAVGVTWASTRYLRGFRDMSPHEAFKRFKVELARTLTLALEILVISDVIESIVVKPTYQSLAVLAFLVLLRTTLSWTLALQIEGHWPWQHPAKEHVHA